MENKETIALYNMNKYNRISLILRDSNPTY